MPLPKKIKKHIPLTESKTLLSRRQELVDKINKDGTFLPKSLLHADLDGGFLEFVKNELKTVIDGKVIPTIDILVTTQNWSQFTETWNLQNLDKNVEPPFITTVRVPEVKFGTNPAVLYNIPNRRQYFYAQVPTWNGQRNGMDIYKIPQPVPIDISYTVKIVCNRMREINEFNKNVIEKFASKQAYQVIKGHYIPIVMGNISDESVMELEKRKFYIQSYEFTLLGFLIDENEFEVSPAVSRVLQVVEFDTSTTKRRVKKDINIGGNEIDVLFVVGNNVNSQIFDYTTNIIIATPINVTSFDVYINNDYYGSDLTEIQINTDDKLKFVIVKTDNTIESIIKLFGNPI
jgi:hypothetical protein